MTAKCANPQCSVPFYRLGGGKLFRFEVREPSEPCRDIPQTICGMKSGHASVFFWLCGKCRLTMTLKFDCVGGLIVEPIGKLRESVPVARSLEAYAND